MEKKDATEAALKNTPAKTPHYIEGISNELLDKWLSLVKRNRLPDETDKETSDRLLKKALIIMNWPDRLNPEFGRALDDSIATDTHQMKLLDIFIDLSIQNPKPSRTVRIPLSVLDTMLGVDRQDVVGILESAMKSSIDLGTIMFGKDPDPLCMHIRHIWESLLTSQENGELFVNLTADKEVFPFMIL